jgi:hypothetical protein
MKYPNGVGYPLGVPLELPLLALKDLPDILTEEEKSGKLLKATRAFMFDRVGYHLQSFLIAKGTPKMCRSLTSIENEFLAHPMLTECVAREYGIGLVQKACTVPGINKLILDKVSHKVVVILKGSMAVSNPATQDSLTLIAGCAGAIDNISNKEVALREGTVGITFAFVPKTVVKPIWDLYDPY